MPPRKALHVAEKPSVAKELAAILSSNRATSKIGPSPFNPIFEFDGTLDNGPCHMKVTSVLGHLMEMEFDDQHRKWNSCAHGALFDAPLFTNVRQPCGNTDYQKVAKNIETACLGCTDLILWLDCDREGEAIGFEVINVCCRVNNRLRPRRARFSALIPRDIHYALANLVQPDNNQSEAVLARSEIDLRLGAAFTRMQTTALQNKFDGLGDSGPLSYGPCQFPTMWFVAQRAERIRKFVSEEFWQIEMRHNATSEDGEPLDVRFSWARHRLFDKLATVSHASCSASYRIASTCARFSPSPYPPRLAPPNSSSACALLRLSSRHTSRLPASPRSVDAQLVLYEVCVGRGTASVTSVTAKPTSRRRPTPLATVELQRDAASKLRISSDRTMEMAEKLYQQGYLSYVAAASRTSMPRLGVSFSASLVC